MFSLLQSLAIGASLGNTGNNIQLCRIFDTGIIELRAWVPVEGSIFLIKYILPLGTDGWDGIDEYHSIYANGEVGQCWGACCCPKQVSKTLGRVKITLTHPILVSVFTD